MCAMQRKNMGPGKKVSAHLQKKQGAAMYAGINQGRLAGMDSDDYQGGVRL